MGRLQVKFDKIHLILALLFVGSLLYINFCSESDSFTKKQGDELANQVTRNIEAMKDTLLNDLAKKDSSKIIHNHYSTIYKNEITNKDSLINANPLIADSLFLFWINRLRSEPAFNINGQ